MRPRPISVKDAAQMLAPATTHLLICDTCALLDIVRLPVREDDPIRLKRTLATVSAIESMVTSRQVTLICPEPVPTEWDNNITQRKGETENCLQSMIHMYDRIAVLSESQGIILASCPIKAASVTTFLHD